MASQKLVFVTGNAMKLKEVQEILNAGTPWTIQLESRSFDIPEVQGTTQEVAIAKCKRAAELISGPCITEDTALCFHAMNDLPGPYIKYFLEELGHEGLNKMLAGFSDKSAHSLCTFAYSTGPGTEPILFEGRDEGTIVPPRGPALFGWNPIFECKATGKTYAEMNGEEKNRHSHRSRALEKLRGFLQKQHDSEIS